MHANLELLLATLNVIMAIALMGLIPFTLRRLKALGRHQQYLLRLVHSIKNERPPNREGRAVLHVTIKDLSEDGYVFLLKPGVGIYRFNRL
jgi:hypothetical protein